MKKLTTAQIVLIREENDSSRHVDHGITIGHYLRIIANRVWVDPNYTPPKEGRSRRLTWDQIHQIRKENDSAKYNNYKITQGHYSNIIFNRVWIDPNYTPPKPRRPRILTLEQIKLIRLENDSSKHRNYGITQGHYSNIIANRVWIDPDYTPKTKI